ncbi:undecaprenyl-diphosphate phosphatase [Corynebacterium frankenforstense]
MSWAQVIVLSIVQGLTEFLPVSSSGHLRIVSELFWGQDAGASFTAVVQLGTEAAVLVFFARDIWRIVTGWFRGLRDREARGLDYRMGWMVIVGTIPVGLIGFLGKDIIRENLRNLWITATVLVLFSFMFILAERQGRKTRSFDELTMKDAVVMGLWQCLSLIPGVSRSGGTISGGLFLGLDREVATRFSFLLAIPAVLASGLFSLPDAFNPQAGQAATGMQLAVGTVICFALGYVCIAWLLKFVSNHSFAWFAAYRIPAGLIVMLLLATGVLQPV